MADNRKSQRRFAFPAPRHRGYDAGMALALLIFGVASAAFCVWLTVRIVNRQERWAKRTAVSLVLLLVGYSPISREELASAIGWEANGSNLRNRLTELSAIEVITYPGRGMVALQEWVVA